MSTMVKEKPRTKKKTKEKSAARTEVVTEVPSVANLSISEEVEAPAGPSTSINATEDNKLLNVSAVSANQERIAFTNTEVKQDETILQAAQSSELTNTEVCKTSEFEKDTVSAVENTCISQNESTHQTQTHVYRDVNRRLDILTLKDIPMHSVPIEELENKLEASTSYLSKTIEPAQEETTQETSVDSDVVNAMPSAPVFEEVLVTEAPVEAVEVLQHVIPRVQCMPLEVAMQVFGGKEMAEVRQMSEREEAIVEAGSLSGPEHPLVDLLSTFRCSVTALEQERHKVLEGYSAEEKSREALWKVEKHTVSVSEKCKCGLTVSYKGQYDHAELMKSKLPAAQLRLEGLLRDVQESYCHHQHAALLAYYQIEEFVADTLQSSKGEIREAIMLILHELRMSVAAPPLLCGALRRWARALCHAMADGRDSRAVLFLLHQLFRQTRSVSWAAGLVRVPIVDFGDAARALAVLDLLLSGPALETARECSEDNDEMWEEVDKHGGGGLVSEGALRERDLLALLRGFPLHTLLGALLLLAGADITQTRPYEWHHSARSVLRALCGVRALLVTLRRALAAHGGYPRLRAVLATVAKAALHASAALYEHNKDSYSQDMVDRIEAELEALFAEGAAVGGAWPALLRPAARAAYCLALCTRLHDKSPIVLDAPPMELAALPCAQSVRVVAQAAADCRDHELARMVLDFLVKTAIKRKSVCGGLCCEAARACLPRLLRAHDYLFATALHIVAELHQVEPLQLAPDTLKFLSLQAWRPAPDEARAVLDDWSRRCPQLLQYLLHELSYTPYDGLSLEAQLTVGAWLCQLPAPTPEWAWSVLTRLRVHRSSWRLPLDAPPPEHTTGPFAQAYAVLSSSWGHSVPEICEYGVSALCLLAEGERATVAAHALPLVMAAMAASPESVSLTPRFGELIVSLLAPAQSLVQWAWGCRAAAPELLLRRMLLQLETQSADRDAIASAWLLALCHPRLPGPRLAVRDAALLAARRTRTPQEAPKAEFLSHLLRNVQHAPLSVDAALRATHAERELATQLFDKLLRALDAQRTANVRIHVDNALKLCNSAGPMSSEQLVVYRAAAAVLAAPAAQPASLALWQLLMHLYLHTATTSRKPIGPLFFAGIIKSRTLTQLKKRLQEHIVYHHNQVDTFKSLLNTRPEPKPSTSAEPSEVVPVTNMLPPTSISQFTGIDSDSSDSEVIDDSDSDSDSDGLCDDDSASESEERRRVNINMMLYHEAAEKMLREYSCWLEAGERLRAAPHHADMARFIPDPVLSTAWAEQLRALRPPRSPADDDLRPPRPAPAPAKPPSPLQTAVKWILKIKQTSHKRSQAPLITSPVDDVNFGNQRQLYCLVDKRLAEIETFAKQWATDVSSVATLDSKLWQLVCALRVRVPLAPVARACSNQCAPVTLPLQGCHEWRISEGATTGIRHNRAAARKAVANLCRARPQQARTVAVLNTIARRLRSQEAALGVASRAWACAGALPACPPASAALTALVDQLADRWFGSNDEAVSSLLERWCSASAAPGQHALCGALLARCAANARQQRPRLYAALLRALPVAGTLSPQRAFSYLSKLDVSQWAGDEAQRGETLLALTQAAQAWGREPQPELHMLIELIGVHTVALTNASHLPLVVLRAARAASAGRAPPAHLAHAARAAAIAAQLPFDQLGNLLRELGVIWWEARSSLTCDATWHAEYAPHAAALQHALLRAFVATACMLSYTPERVSWYAWPALQESWAAWVCPHPALPPLPPPAPPAAPEPRAAMLKRFVDCLHQIMLDCPDCEEFLLSQVWEWAVQMYLNVTSVTASQDSRVQLSDLLSELSTLPWREHQWLRGNCINAALQIATTSDVEMQAWVAATLQGVQAATWLRDATDYEVAPRLAALLQLFTGPLLLHTETLEQATLLPWSRLPELALEQTLERFFVEHHNPLLPYHASTQFRVILAAGGLSPAHPASRGKRACAVSHWTRAACAPPLAAHVPAQTQAALALIAGLEAYTEESSELEELLERAVVVMCLEPAAAAALPVWQQWVAGATARAAAACVSAARALTSFPYFAALADAAIAACMAKGGSWADVWRRTEGCAWAEPGRLLGGAAHAAYALARAQPLPGLNPADLHYDSHELIASVWICVLCRAALAGAGAARAQLQRGAEPPRAAILRAVLRAADEPTHKQRLLCRLALCIITPNSDPLIRAYETAYPPALPSNPEALSWGRGATIRHLPMLAVKLFPANENYFAEEIKMADEIKMAEIEMAEAI